MKRSCLILHGALCRHQVVEGCRLIVLRALCLHCVLSEQKRLLGLAGGRLSRRYRALAAACRTGQPVFRWGLRCRADDILAQKPICYSLSVLGQGSRAARPQERSLAGAQSVLLSGHACHVLVLCAVILWDHADLPLGVQSQSPGRAPEGKRGLRFCVQGLRGKPLGASAVLLQSSGRVLEVERGPRSSVHGLRCLTLSALHAALRALPLGALHVASRSPGRVLGIERRLHFCAPGLQGMLPGALHALSGSPCAVPAGKPMLRICMRGLRETPLGALHASSRSPCGASAGQRTLRFSALGLRSVLPGAPREALPSALRGRTEGAFLPEMAQGLRKAKVGTLRLRFGGRMLRLRM